MNSFLRQRAIQRGPRQRALQLRKKSPWLPSFGSEQNLENLRLFQLRRETNETFFVVISYSESTAWIPGPVWVPQYTGALRRWTGSSATPVFDRDQDCPSQGCSQGPLPFLPYLDCQLRSSSCWHTHLLIWPKASTERLGGSWSLASSNPMISFSDSPIFVPSASTFWSPFCPQIRACRFARMDSVCYCSFGVATTREGEKCVHPC